MSYVIPREVPSSRFEIPSTFLYKIMEMIYNFSEEQYI